VSGRSQCGSRSYLLELCETNILRLFYSKGYPEATEAFKALNSANDSIMQKKPSLFDAAAAREAIEKASVTSETSQVKLPRIEAMKGRKSSLIHITTVNASSNEKDMSFRFVLAAHKVLNQKSQAEKDVINALNDAWTRQVPGCILKLIAGAPLEKLD